MPHAPHSTSKQPTENTSTSPEKGKHGGNARPDPAKARSTNPSAAPILLIKYGGNAMTDPELRDGVLRTVASWSLSGYRVVLVHGGGPFIGKAMEADGHKSQFSDGHRITPPEAYSSVERALRLDVNAVLVRRLQALGHAAVGLTGCDGEMVHVRPKQHRYRDPMGKEVRVDLGRVGEVEKVQPGLLHALLDAGFMPVIACLACDAQGQGYNVNADVFAGHLAAALNAQSLVLLTDVDGLRADPEDPESTMARLPLGDVDALTREGVISGGMLPKLDACRIALQGGARKARIANGTKPVELARIFSDAAPGTLVTP